jgi:hypothetical protein
MGEYLFMKFHVILMYASLLFLLYLLNACRGWFDTSFDGGAKHHRVVNQVLGNLLHFHWLGLATHPVSAEEVPCLNWDMFRYQFDSQYQHAHGAVWNVFWLSFPYRVNCHLF